MSESWRKVREAEPAIYPDPAPDHEQAERLEDLVERGEVASALLLKGDFSEAETLLAQEAYEIGVKHGRAALAAQLAEAQGIYDDLADERVRNAKLAAQLAEREREIERLRKDVRDLARWYSMVSGLPEIKVLAALDAAGGAEE